MIRRTYLKALVQFLASAIYSAPSFQEAMNIRGEVVKGDFSRYYGCKKCYNRKAKGLAIEARHNRRKV